MAYPLAKGDGQELRCGEHFQNTAIVNTKSSAEKCILRRERQ
jgi:hypothetical protein